MSWPSCNESTIFLARWSKSYVVGVLGKKGTLLAEQLRLVADRAYCNDTLMKVLPLNPRCSGPKIVYFDHASYHTGVLFRHWFPSSMSLKTLFQS